MKNRSLLRINSCFPWTFVLLFLLLLFQSTDAQVLYQRKSVSHLNVVWLATPSAREVPPKVVEKMLREVRDALTMERFDDNPLPEPLIRRFVDEANRQGDLTMDQIASLMREHLVPPLKKLLEETAPLRARELITEAHRQEFLTTKAKEWGITEEQLERVMNSAFIYLPVLTKYSLEKGKDSDRWTAKMEGGVIWFKVIISESSSQIVERAVLTTFSMGYGNKDFAVENCAMNFARNLQVATRDLEEFQLVGQIYEVQGGDISFNLGRKEGLGYDEPMLVGEWEDLGEGKIRFVRDGWARVTRVADNRTSPSLYSHARAIKKGSWGPGMMVKEYPRLRIDVALKPTLASFKQEASIYYDEFTGFIPSFDIDAHYNVSPLFGLGSFFLVGLNLSIPPDLFYDPELSSSLWGFHFGYFKRYYLRQLGVNWEVKYGWRWFEIKEEETLWENRLSGGEVALGLDWAFSPDFNLGVQGGYKLYNPSTKWQSVSWYHFTSPSEIDLGGLKFGIYLHWSPPALPFDPFGLLRGALVGQ